MRKLFYETFIFVFVAAAVWFGLRFTIQTFIIDGPSMEPNFQQNERIIINKLAFVFSPPQIGDIIVFYPPIPSTKPYIKRVIGLPGDVVQIVNGTVYIHKADGGEVTLEEPYIKEPFYTNYTSPVIPADEYFVMGDNRNDSSDSR